MDPTKDIRLEDSSEEHAAEGQGETEDSGRRLFHHSGGVTYFKKSTERNFFLILTILALLWAVIDRLGLF